MALHYPHIVNDEKPGISKVEDQYNECPGRSSSTMLPEALYADSPSNAFQAEHPSRRIIIFGTVNTSSPMIKGQV